MIVYLHVNMSKMVERSGAKGYKHRKYTYINCYVHLHATYAYHLTYIKYVSKC